LFEFFSGGPQGRVVFDRSQTVIHAENAIIAVDDSALPGTRNSALRAAAKRDSFYPRGSSRSRRIALNFLAAARRAELPSIGGRP